MKWLIAAVVAAIVAGIVYLRLYTVKTTYVNGLAPYTTLPGHEFFLEKDCYIFKFKDHDSNWPLLGSHEAVADLPAEVTETDIGANFPSVRILGVLRIGDRFRILSIRRDESRTRTTISFEILLEDETTRKYPRLDAYWIMDHSPEANGGAPSIMTTYAVLRGKE